MIYEVGCAVLNCPAASSVGIVGPSLTPNLKLPCSQEPLFHWGSEAIVKRLQNITTW